MLRSSRMEEDQVPPTLRAKMSTRGTQRERPGGRGGLTEVAHMGFWSIR